MTTSYKFGGGSEQKAFGPLPEGDYAFIVSSCDEPYQKESGNWVLSVKLSIQPGGETVFANPWTGKDRDGNERDDIGSFLLAVNRAPKVGDEPQWTNVVGARGKCRLKVEVAQMGALAGKEVNKVAWFHRPRQVGPTTQGPVEGEWEGAQRRARAGVGAPNDLEPDDIPFRTRIYKDVRQSRLNRRVF